MERLSSLDHPPAAGSRPPPRRAHLSHAGGRVQVCIRIRPFIEEDFVVGKMLGEDVGSQDASLSVNLSSGAAGVGFGSRAPGLVTNLPRSRVGGADLLSPFSPSTVTGRRRSGLSSVLGLATPALTPNRHSFRPGDVIRSCLALDPTSRILTLHSDLAFDFVSTPAMRVKDGHASSGFVARGGSSGLTAQSHSLNLSSASGLWSVPGGSVSAMLPIRTSMTSVASNRKYFSFDTILGEGATQAEVYARVGQPLLEAVVGGVNATLLAYGQTGAGKTHTLFGRLRYHGIPERERGMAGRASLNLSSSLGGPASFLPGLHNPATHPSDGMVPRLLSGLFETLGELSVVKVSFLQIYTDIVHDLIDPSKKNLQIRETKDGEIFVQDATCCPVDCASGVLNLLCRALQNRATAPTLMNASSSRSHVVLLVKITQQSELRATSLHSTLTIVDLAGSEQLKKTNSTGQRLRECKFINRSLAALGNCVSALIDRRHVPFRDSKLTRLLTNSLNGNARTSIVANIGPSNLNYHETLSTLLFALRAQKVRVHARVNEVVNEKSELRQRLAIANTEKVMLMKRNAQLEKEIQFMKQKFQVMSEVFKKKELILRSALSRQDETIARLRRDNAENSIVDVLMSIPRIREEVVARVTGSGIGQPMASSGTGRLDDIGSLLQQLDEQEESIRKVALDRRKERRTAMLKGVDVEEKGQPILGMEEEPVSLLPREPAGEIGDAEEAEVPQQQQEVPDESPLEFQEETSPAMTADVGELVQVEEEEEEEEGESHSEWIALRANIDRLSADLSVESKKSSSRFQDYSDLTNMELPAHIAARMRETDPPEDDDPEEIIRLALEQLRSQGFEITLDEDSEEEASPSTSAVVVSNLPPAARSDEFFDSPTAVPGAAALVDPAYGQELLDPDSMSNSEEESEGAGDEDLKDFVEAVGEDVAISPDEGVFSHFDDEGEDDDDDGAGTRVIDVGDIDFGVEEEEEEGEVVRPDRPDSPEFVIGEGEEEGGQEEGQEEEEEAGEQLEVAELFQWGRSRDSFRTCEPSEDELIPDATFVLLPPSADVVFVWVGSQASFPPSLSVNSWGTNIGSKFKKLRGLEWAIPVRVVAEFETSSSSDTFARWLE